MAERDVKMLQRTIRTILLIKTSAIPQYPTIVWSHNHCNPRANIIKIGNRLTDIYIYKPDIYIYMIHLKHRISIHQNHSKPIHQPIYPTPSKNTSKPIHQTFKINIEQLPASESPRMAYQFYLASYSTTKNQGDSTPS